MRFFIGFIFCTVLSLINLPFVSGEGLGVFSLMAMVLSGACAVHQLIRAVGSFWRL